MDEKWWFSRVGYIVPPPLVSWAYPRTLVSNRVKMVFMGRANLAPLGRIPKQNTQGRRGLKQIFGNLIVWFRDQIGKTPVKRSGHCWLKVTHFLVVKALKTWKNRLKWHVFGAAGAENFEKFRWFRIKLLIFVKIEVFIAWKCIVMHKMTNNVEKLLYTGYFLKFQKRHIFEKSQF